MEWNEAIEKSILKWEILAETGEYRRYIEGITSENMPHGCALCQLAGQPQYHVNGISRYRCRRYCPYAQQFEICCNRGSPFQKWEGVNRDNIRPGANARRKHYAAEFLSQLKQLSKA